MRQVRGKVIEYTVFRNGSQFLGTATVDLPSIQFLTSTFKGAGISGEIDVPIQGQVGSMEVTLNWDVVDPAALELLAPVTHALDLRMVQQVMETGSGNLSHEPTRISLRGMTKTGGLGSVEKGSDLGGSTVLEITYLKTVINGKTMLEIDKLNGTYIVNGVDYSVNYRAALGL